MSDRQIIEAIRKISGQQLTDEVYILACSVESVDVDARTCECTAISGNAAVDVPAVQLMAEVDDGILHVPAIGSTVLVVFSKRNVPYVAMFSEISAIHYVVGDSTIDVTDGLTEFNGGAFGGLIKIQGLVTKLNNLENLVNDLIGKFNTHVHTGVQTGSSASGTTPQQETDTLTPTVRADLENTKVTHG